HVEDVARLARRDRRAAVHRPEGLFAHGHSPGVAALAVVWPRKMRVRANSPSLCPTISSVTNTRTNVFPLWTANVWPTKSGMIVDERLHVRSGSRWLWDFCARTRRQRRLSTCGSFFIDLDMGLLRRSCALPRHFVRRLRIRRLLDFLRLRVLPPLASLPHGEHGGRPAPDRPSPPP